MKRKFTKKLNMWLNDKEKLPLMVVGARQIGKTYIINEFCEKNFKNYVYINLEKREDIKEVLSLQLTLKL